jgi:para-nitrobenzyl esterase
MKKLTRFSTYSLLIAGLLASLTLVSCSPEPKKTQEPVVKTTYGSISGSVEDGVFSFKGIPYAKAERFMPPQAPDAWEGVRDATKFGPIAMQVNAWSPAEAMNEEKLFTVNVWTQGINDGKKRPAARWWFCCRCE